MNILIVEDDEPYAAKMSEPFRDDDVVHVSNLTAARAALNEAWPAVVILDLMFPDRPSDGRPRFSPSPPFMAGKFLDALEQLGDETGNERPNIIVVSAHEEPASPTRFREVAEWLECKRIRTVLPKSAMNMGMSFFQAVLRHTVDGFRHAHEMRAAITQAGDAFASLDMHGIITRDPQMADVWRRIESAARSGWNVYVQGETGTGKELVARAIAKLRRSTFLPVLCSTIPETLFEGEMFGTRKGAGADLMDRPGKIEEAGNGVLLLDEVLRLTENNQTKLLRVVDEDIREFNRLGENTIRKADCMFVFTGQIPLEEAFGNDTFRHDLAIRIAAITIQLPALRQRGAADIALLTEHFLKRFCTEQNRVIRLSPDVIIRFQNGKWPGNVRGLANMIKSLVTNCSCVITLEDLKTIIPANQLAHELGISSDEIPEQAPEGNDPATSVVITPHTLLTQLATEVGYRRPPTWRSIGSKNLCDEKGEAQIEALLTDILDLVMNASGRELVSALEMALKARKLDNKPSNSPRRLHHYKALLYFVLHPKHEGDLNDLERVLGLKSWEQRKKVAEGLMKTLADKVPRSLVIMQELPPNNRQIFRLNDGLLQSALEERTSREQLRPRSRLKV